MDDERLDSWLRSTRPAPDAGWRRATEERLFARRRPLLRLPPAAPALRVAAGLAATFAAVLITLTLASGGADRSARAKDRCHTVTVTRTVRVPTIGIGADGQPVIVKRKRVVQRPEQRCR